jgi:Cd2+/Zn2+-exporting ATPase
MSVRESTRQQFRVGGMDCPSCAARIERHLRGVAGVTDAQVQFAAGRVTVTYAPDAVTPDDLAAALDRLGHPVEADAGADRSAPRPPEAPPEEHGACHAGCCSAPSGHRQERGTRGWLARWAPTLAAGVGIAAGFAAQLLGAAPAIWQALFGAGILAGGVPVARAAWTALRARHTTDVNFLMLLAVIGAVALGDWVEAATVLVLFSIAGALEAHSMERARQAIRALVNLAPPAARVREPDGERLVPVEQVPVGARLSIRPGDRIPLDGEVLSGVSTVNQAAITGESLPAEKASGDPVFAGTFNERGSLEVRVTRSAADSTLARIVQLVEDAQANRSATEQFIDRFARVYTPAILMVAALLAVVPPLLLHAAWQTWIYRALTLLIVACPCALVISTPVAIVCALTRAARGGALIKGGAALERAGAIQAIAFDKTGTLTLGRPALTDVVSMNGVSERELLRLAAGVERHSEHLVAQAIGEGARDAGLAVPVPEAFEALPGQGARAVVEGRPLVVGKPALIRDRLGLGGATAADALTSRLQEEGKTVVWLAEEAATGSGPGANRWPSAPPPLVGLLAVADTPREAARDTVTALRKLGIARVEMMTGDNPATAAAVAAAVGIDHYHAELLPADKVARIQALEAEVGPTAMVGDGINDAPALALASVGVAMGAAGTDVALETAEIALMGDDLTRLPGVIALSRRTLRIIQANVTLSLLVKAGFIALTMAGLGSLWLAVVADTGCSLVVVANSLRLLRSDRSG